LHDFRGDEGGGVFAKAFIDEGEDAVAEGEALEGGPVEGAPEGGVEGGVTIGVHAEGGLDELELGAAEGADGGGKF